jgi:hypothetical protein
MAVTRAKQAIAAMKTGAKGASIPYDPRRRGVTRSVIMITFSSISVRHNNVVVDRHSPSRLLNKDEF